MITINNAPISGRILLDANSTIVSITSNNGLGYYFRALIYVNDVLHDTQGWSRKDDFTAEKDLKKLYNAYYDPVFNQEFTEGLTEQSHLIKKINIVIQERSLADDTIQQTATFPEFFFMYNVAPTVFDDLTKVQFLGLDTPVMQVGKNGNISIPFMVNADSENVSVELSDNLDTVLDFKSAGTVTGSRVYLYNFDLKSIELSDNALYLNIKVAVGTSFVIKHARIILLPDYPVKEIAYMNNFGYWIYAYLDGQFSSDSNFEILKYETNDNQERIFEINESETYTINSGSLLASEKELIRQICLSLKTYLRIGNEWLEMSNTTKKISTFRERTGNYSESLVFNLRKNASIENTATDRPVFEESLVISDVVVEIVEEGISTGVNIRMWVEFFGIEAEDPVTLVMTKSGIDNLYTVPVYTLPTTGQKYIYYGLGGLDYPRGNYNVKVRLLSDPSVESNVIPVTV